MAGSTRRKSKNLLKKHIRRPKKQNKTKPPLQHTERRQSLEMIRLRTSGHSSTATPMGGAGGWARECSEGGPQGARSGLGLGARGPPCQESSPFPILEHSANPRPKECLTMPETLYPSWQHLLIKRPGTAGREGKEWSCSPLSTACPTAAAKLSEVTGWTLTPARIPVVLEQVIKTEMTYNDNYLRKMFLLKMSSAP